MILSNSRNNKKQNYFQQKNIPLSQFFDPRKIPPNWVASIGCLWVQKTILWGEMYRVYITQSCLLTTIYVQNLSFRFGQFVSFFFQIFALPVKTFFPKLFYANESNMLLRHSHKFYLKGVNSKKIYFRSKWA